MQTDIYDHDELLPNAPKTEVSYEYTDICIKVICMLQFNTEHRPITI
jgi:hypothetical protein